VAEPNLPLPVESTPKSSGRERRVTVRFSCDVKTSCQPLAGRKAGSEWAARVKDVSLGGLGLVLNRRFEPGTLITVVPFGPESSRLLLARVVYAAVLPDGHWHVGCELLDSLGEDDLKALQ
jgi:hypothetical protein